NSMMSSFVSGVIVYFTPDVSGSRNFSGNDTGGVRGPAVARPSEDDPDPCGASITPTFTSPGPTSVMMNVPADWMAAAEYAPSGPTNFRMPDRSGWPLYVTVPWTVTFLTPLSAQPAAATAAITIRPRRRPADGRENRVVMAVPLV